MWTILPAKSKSAQDLQRELNTNHPIQEDKRFLWGCPPKRLNAVEQFKAFNDAEVPTLNWTTSKEKAKKWVSEGKVVFGRKLLHTMGRDIKLYPPSKVYNRDLYTLFCPSLREFRVHIWGDKSVLRRQKVGYGAANEPEIPIRNRANSYVFEVTDVLNDKEVSKLWKVSKEAVKACNYAYGAVDVLQTEGGEFVVLEVNARPGLCENSVKTYAKLIKNHLYPA